MSFVKLFLLASLAFVGLGLGQEASNYPEAPSDADPDTPASIDFTGTYIMTESDADNFDLLLQELDIGYFKRLVAKMSGSTYIISHNPSDDTWTLQTKTTFSNNAVTFTNGTAFDEPRADGKTVKSTITIRGNTWYHTQAGNPEVNIVRVFTGDGILVTTKCKAVTLVRKYVKE